MNWKVSPIIQGSNHNQILIWAYSDDDSSLNWERPVVGYGYLWPLLGDDVKSIKDNIIAND